MSRTRDKDNDRRPRLTVILVEDHERRPLIESLRARAHVLDRSSMAARARSASERRSESEAASLAELEAEYVSAEARRVASEKVNDDLVEEQRRTRDAADWCDMQPAQDRDGAERIATSNQTLEEHSRTVRESNRRLERVLEQRAAAEAALEDARRELGGLGAAGEDETDVRRQMEAASRRVHDVNGDYQEQMLAVARLKAEVWALEDSASAGPSARSEEPPDQLSAMRAALQAKLAAASASESGTIDVVPVTAEAIEEARTAARDAEDRAAALAEELTLARRAVDDLENELSTRTREVDIREERQAAASALESQVAAVERQLGDAEADCRADVDAATRAMSRAELSLERLRQEARDRRRQLRAFESLLPVSERPPSDDDPVLHARTIGRALRAHADAMESDRLHAQSAVDRDRARSAGMRNEIDDRRVRQGRILPEDVVATIQRGADDSTLVIIDDAVTDDEVLAADGAGISLTALAGIETSVPVIVLSTDVDVVGSAIDLPDDRARVIGKTWLYDLAFERAGSGAPASDQTRS